MGDSFDRIVLSSALPEYRISIIGSSMVDERKRSCPIRIDLCIEPKFNVIRTLVSYFQV